MHSIRGNPSMAWQVEIHVTREKGVESLWERKWRAVGHHSDAWSQGCLRRGRLLQVCSYCTYRILATHARLPPMFTPKLIPTAWMPVKLTGSVVGRLDGVHDDNNKRSSLSLLLSSPTLSFPLSSSDRCPSPFSLRLSFSSSFLLPLSLSARARRPLWSLASFVHLNTAFRVARPTRIPGENPVISKRKRETSTRRKKRVESGKEGEGRVEREREISWGPQRRKVSFAITNEPSLYPSPPFFTDHLLPTLPLSSSRSSLPWFFLFFFFFFFFFLLCRSLLSHCAPRTAASPRKYSFSFSSSRRITPRDLMLLNGLNAGEEPPRGHFNAAL